MILGFTFWLAQHGDESDPMSNVLDDYVFWAYDSNQVAKQQVVNLIAGICIICPAWNTNGTLTMAHKALRGWTRIKPSRSRLPVPGAS